MGGIPTRTPLLVGFAPPPFLSSPEGKRKEGERERERGAPVCVKTGGSRVGGPELCV